MSSISKACVNVRERFVAESRKVLVRVAVLVVESARASG